MSKEVFQYQDNDEEYDYELEYANELLKLEQQESENG
jgi:hypothetical protein|tara:strand:+ start:5968 stop:6078 length:111 start_codon:yes stop_codon:yes gene_type:complete